MYHVVHRMAPVYLAELCQPCTDPRRWSAARGDLEIPCTNRHFTNSSFSITAPTAWNKLPTHICTSTTLSSFLSRPQDSPVHYIICCSLGLVTVYGAPELWLWGALENAILIDWLNKFRHSMKKIFLFICRLFDVGYFVAARAFVMISWGHMKCCCCCCYCYWCCSIFTATHMSLSVPTIYDGFSLKFKVHASVMNFFLSVIN